MGKGKSGKTSKKQEEAPKCTCDHPYTCTCGNRPPRPSKGHKWDYESQLWGGKGHKQKGASGQTASVAQPKTTLSSGTTLSQHEKLPSQLLDQVCQKQGRPRPKYKSIGNAKYRVIVQDAKASRRGTDHDLIFVPKSSAETDEIAREEAALLALLHMTPTLPHERKLPQPYKTTWLGAVEAAKQSKRTENNTSNDSNRNNNDSQGTQKDGGSNANSSLSQPLAMAGSFASAAERRKHQDAKQRERNARTRRHEAIRLANRDHPVFMSAKCRQQLESLLRGDTNIVIEEVEGEDGDEGDDNDEVKTYVVHRLHSEGFTLSQARTAFGQLSHETLQDESEWDSVYDECLQWLCIHLDENQLPEGFDPRGRTLDVVVAPTAASALAKNGGTSTTTKNEGAIALARKYAISEREAILLLQQAPKSSVEQVLWTTFCRAADTVLENDDSNDPSVTKDDEIETLQAVFSPEECTFREESGKTTVFITIPSNDGSSFALEIVLNNDTYPFSYPERVLLSGGWQSSDGIGTAIHVEMVKFVATLPKGEPMIYEIYGQATSLIHASQDGGIEPASLMTALGVKESGVTSKDANKTGQAFTQRSDTETKAATKQKKIRRPREKTFFWSTTPEQTPAATAFPKISPRIERDRKSLPAAKARDDFLSVMKQVEEVSHVHPLSSRFVLIQES